MSKHYEVLRFTDEHFDAAAQLLADRHRRHRLASPALNSAYEDAARCAPVIEELLALEGSLGAIAYSAGRPAGYIVFTPRPIDMWGPNAWAEDAGNAGEREAIRECYAALAGDLADAGIRGHWAMVPASDAQAIDGWFSMSFGMQHAYAYREPVGTDFQPTVGDGLRIRRPTAADLAALMDLDGVLPAHLAKAPVFSKLVVSSGPEAEAELAADLQDPKYTFWVADYDGRVVATMVGTSIETSSSWAALMRPRSAALLGYAATLPDARGLGAGRALTDVFMAWARDKGYEWLATDWRSTNLEANRTWRAMGFRPVFYRLFRAIP